MKLKKIMSSKTVAVILAIAYAFFILTFSIGLPIYFRPFYYAHIKPLNLEGISGRSFAEIKFAYDELLDYLVFGTPFGMGDFKHSESGQSHFADCKTLFDLNGIVLLITAAILLFALIYRLKTKEDFATLKGYSPSFWGSVVLLVVIALVGLYGAIDFDGLFVAFHTVFFPRKTNWWFDPTTDEIILVMPWEFFRDCAILIGVSVVVLCAIFIGFGVRRNRKTKNAD